MLHSGWHRCRLGSQRAHAGVTLTEHAAQDGIAIAWALSEHLLALGAYTLLATHFSKLVQLEGLYPNCKAQQLGGSQAQGERWKLGPYSQQQSHYGLLLAPQASLHVPARLGVAPAASSAATTAPSCTLGKPSRVCQCPRGKVDSLIVCGSQSASGLQSKTALRDWQAGLTVACVSVAAQPALAPLC